MKYVGVYFQPIHSIQKWKSRGINVMFGCELQNNTVTKDAYKKECKRLGMKYYDVVTAAENVEALAADPDLLGFMMEDEPDRRILNPSYDTFKKANADPKRKAEAQKIWADIQKYVAAYSALANRIRKTGKPVFQNFAGSTVGAAYGWYKGDCHKWLLPFIDELSMDFYPKNNNAPRYPNTHVGMLTDLLVKWNDELKQPKKPIWTVLECSDQKLNDTSRAPTVADMEEQFAQCVARDMKGIIWFPQQIGGGFKYDAVVEPQLTAMQTLSKRFISEPATPEQRIAKLEAENAQLKSALKAIGELVAKNAK